MLITPQFSNFSNRSTADWHAKHNKACSFTYEAAPFRCYRKKNDHHYANHSEHNFFFVKFLWMKLEFITNYHKYYKATRKNHNSIHPIFLVITSNTKTKYSNMYVYLYVHNPQLSVRINSTFSPYSGIVNGLHVFVFGLYKRTSAVLVLHLKLGFDWWLNDDLCQTVL